MNSRDRRLEVDYQHMKKLKEQSHGKLDFSHNGNPERGKYPDTYHVTLKVRGMASIRGVEVLAEKHEFDLILHSQYPSLPPRIHWKTVIFHPNIQVFNQENAEYQQLLHKWNGNEDEMWRDLETHPNFLKLLDGSVCLDILKNNWVPSTGLEKIIIEISNMIRFAKYNARNAFTRNAADWTLQQEANNRFPLDREGLLPVKSNAPVINVQGRENL